MKALPKRKGNPCIFHVAVLDRLDLNESPSKKEGKCYALTRSRGSAEASMKALPKRKGNNNRQSENNPCNPRLNESPSEKEGKWVVWVGADSVRVASMKAPPKRKGNFATPLAPSESGAPQ